MLVTFQTEIPELTTCNRDSSKVFIVESSALQFLAIMQNIGESETQSEKLTERFTTFNDFRRFLKKKLDEELHALRLSNLSMKELVLLIHGLDKSDLLVEYGNRKSDLIKQRNEKIDEYKKKVNEWALSTLANYDKYASKFIYY